MCLLQTWRLQQEQGSGSDWWHINQSLLNNDLIRYRIQCVATIKGLSLCPPWKIEEYGDLSEPLDPLLCLPSLQVSLCFILQRNHQPGINSKHIPVLTTLHQWPFLLFALITQPFSSPSIQKDVCPLHRSLFIAAFCVEATGSWRSQHMEQFFSISPHCYCSSLTGFAVKFCQLFHFAVA